MGAPSDSHTGEHTPGSRVGRYVLIEPIVGHSRGLVYLAYDPDLDRRVALSLLETDADADADADEGSRTLLESTRSVANLKHPNILTVHDVGRVEGLVYVAAEFVAGRTVDGWLLEQPRPWREVVATFVAGARGLAAAHEAGVGNCGFRPTNLLIANDDRVLVMDIGVTPDDDRLQAPEGDVDGASDQFSLCAALYEALYGQLPYDPMPPRPDTSLRAPPPKTRVPAQVHRTIERGLAHRASARFGSLTEVASALEPRPRSKRTRQVVLVGVGAAAIAIPIAIAGAPGEDLVVCSGGEQHVAAVWNDAARDAAQTAMLATRVSYAAETWERVGPSLERYAQQWSAAHLEACEATHVHAQQSGEVLDSRMSCLRDALTELGATVSALAAADGRVVERAVAAVEGLPPPSRCRGTGGASRDIPGAAPIRDAMLEAAALRRAGRDADALPIARDALQRAQASGARSLIAEARYEVGETLREMGDFGPAEQQLSEAFFLATRVEADLPASNAAIALVFLVGYQQARSDEGLAWARHAEAAIDRADSDAILVARLNRHLGSLHLRQRRFDLALHYYQRSLSLVEAALGRQTTETARTQKNVGAALQELGRYGEARTHHEDALTTELNRLGAQHPNVAFTLTSLGSVLAREGKHEKALEHYDRALAIWEQARGPAHPDVALALTNKGSVLAEREPALALVYLERALAIWERSFGPTHPNFALTLSNIGTASLFGADPDRARRAFERASLIWEKAVGLSSPVIAFTESGLSHALVDLDRAAVALPHAERALAIAEASGDRQETARARFALARSLGKLATSGSERAVELAEAARRDMADDPATPPPELMAVETWLENHDRPASSAHP